MLVQLSKMLELFRGQQTDLDKKKADLDEAIEKFKLKHNIKLVKNPEN